jgi:hypothetical protein
MTTIWTALLVFTALHMHIAHAVIAGPAAVAAVNSTSQQAPKSLSTKGRLIIDPSTGKRFKLRCASWSGAQEKWYVPNGLWAQHRDVITKQVGRPQHGVWCGGCGLCAAAITGDSVTFHQSCSFAELLSGTSWGSCIMWFSFVSSCAMCVAYLLLLLLLLPTGCFNGPQLHQIGVVCGSCPGAKLRQGGSKGACRGTESKHRPCGQVSSTPTAPNYSACKAVHSAEGGAMWQLTCRE